MYVFRSNSTFYHLQNILFRSPHRSSHILEHIEVSFRLFVGASVEKMLGFAIGPETPSGRCHPNKRQV